MYEEHDVNLMSIILPIPILFELLNKHYDTAKNLL